MNYDVDVPAESRQAWDAIREGDLQTVERWLETGVDPSALLVPGNFTTTPLFLALAPGGMIRDEPSQPGSQAALQVRYLGTVGLPNAFHHLVLLSRAPTWFQLLHMRTTARESQPLFTMRSVAI